MADKDDVDLPKVIEALNEEARVEFVNGFDPDKLSDEQKMALFKQAVLERAHDKCANCGSGHKVVAQMIVPLEAGGQFSFDNGTTVCRACQLASGTVLKSKKRSDTRRPVNFWVSRRMYRKVRKLNGFTSNGELVRFLMGAFVANPDQFDDLALWQEDGADMRMNVWVGRDAYAVFKEKVNERGVTVTDAFKALIRMYEEESEPLIRLKKQEMDG